MWACIHVPSQPINKTCTLRWFGLIEIQRLVDSINSPGRHPIIYGDRGVGQTLTCSPSSPELLQGVVDLKVGKINLRAKRYLRKRVG